MEIIGKEEVASVTLFMAKLSEDEAEACESALSYILATLDAPTIESHFGATRAELEGIRDDLRRALKEHGALPRELEPVAT